MSRRLAGIERNLGEAGFDRAPWLAVAFAAGIAAWIGLPTHWEWLGLVALCLALALATTVLLRPSGEYPFVRSAAITVSLLVAAGCLTVWAKSELVGAEPIDRPGVSWQTAKGLTRQERPAEGRVRLVVAGRLDGGNEQQRMRLNVPDRFDNVDITPGSVVRVRARLMPPAPPMLPGGYNFARTAWFSGLSATGTVISPIDVVERGEGSDFVGRLQTRLARHVREQLDGSAGGIAATLASGDRGGIAEEDAEAMRDSGLAHLLAISGLHVSAVVGAAYLLSVKLLAVWQWLALRVRLPLMGSAFGAMAGIGYTLLTGAQVPTVRSCIGAILVLIALALGREALSLRILAVAAFAVLMLWPESLVGPSFQMSFAAVMAIVALSTSAPARKFLSPREKGWLARPLRYLAMLFATSLLIELVLMPIALYHFHRSGVYGATANLIAIPLTTLVVMPLIAIALVLDIGGLGTPAWWLAGKAIEAMLAMAHWVSNRPGAVTILPPMGAGSYALFIIGGLWLALWRSKIRWIGLVPAVIGVISLSTLRPPDILVSGDGRHVGITGLVDEELLVLRDSRSSYVSDNLTELAGMDGKVQTLDQWPGAQCSREFCAISLNRGDRRWHVLMARSRAQVPERALAAACHNSDIVIADRWLPRSCRPRWFKADRRFLGQSGGLAIDLDERKVQTVADGQGDHGWWQGNRNRKPRGKDAVKRNKRAAPTLPRQ
ncbi:MAG: ComEC/Rec2 family competence protein [Novosphingobium sp.]|nr:ComEC/Rec2 family competence protein [Novosphingobium sp.]